MNIGSWSIFLVSSFIPKPQDTNQPINYSLRNSKWQILQYHVNRSFSSVDRVKWLSDWFQPGLAIELLLFFRNDFSISNYITSNGKLEAIKCRKRKKKTIFFMQYNKMHISMAKINPKYLQSNTTMRCTYFGHLLPSALHICVQSIHLYYISVLERLHLNKMDSLKRRNKSFFFAVQTNSVVIVAHIEINIPLSLCLLLITVFFYFLF